MVKTRDSAPKHTMPTVLRVLLSAVFLFAMSIIFAWFIEVRRASGDFDDAWSFITSHYLILVQCCHYILPASGLVCDFVATISQYGIFLWFY